MSVELAFDRKSKHYDTYAGIQARVAARLAESVSGDIVPGRILDAGCGTGFLASLACRRWPEASVDCLDISAKMLEEASLRLAEYSGRCHLIMADARSYAPVGICYDLLLSSSALHWMYPLNATLKGFHRITSPEGRLAVSLMTKGTFRRLHDLRRELFPAKMPVSDLPDGDKLLKQIAFAGFVPEAWQSDIHEVRYENTRQLFKALHGMGVTGGDYSRGRQLLTLSEMRILMNEYETRYATNGEVVEQFETLQVVARR